MRKRTVRNGLRLIWAALILIVLASFYHVGIADLFSMSADAEMRLYRLGIFWAAAFGGYGVVLAAFGQVLPADSRDTNVRVLPIFFMVLATVVLFFYLLLSSFNEPPRPERVRPGDTISI